MVLCPSNHPSVCFFRSSVFSYFRPLLRPVFSPCCIPYLFFSSTHTVYCLGYPDMKFPKNFSSASVREREKR